MARSISYLRICGSYFFWMKRLAVWEDITPLARNEWICWIESAKKAVHAVGLAVRTANHNITEKTNG